MRITSLASCLLLLSISATAAEFGLSVGDFLSPNPKDSKTVSGTCVASHLENNCLYTTRVMRKGRTHWILLTEFSPETESGRSNHIILDILELGHVPPSSIAHNGCQLNSIQDHSIGAVSAKPFEVDVLSDAVEWAVRVDFDELVFVPLDPALVCCSIQHPVH